MRKAIPWILGLGAILILVVLAISVMSSVNAILQPVVDLKNSVGTQVSSFLHPTPTVLPDPVTIVREVRSLARLETIQYTVEKVITAETRQGPLGFLFGDRLLLVAHGVVIAGVDMGRINPDDIWFDDLGRVYIRLPQAEIFIATLDNEKSYIYDRDTGLLTRGQVDLEAIARQAAEDEIEQAALQDGILEQAQQNAENYIYRLLRGLGFPDVLFVGVDEEASSPMSAPTPLPSQDMNPTPTS
jgi:hypothetical protein